MSFKNIQIIAELVGVFFLVSYESGVRFDGVSATSVLCELAARMEVPSVGLHALMLSAATRPRAVPVRRLCVLVGAV